MSAKARGAVCEMQKLEDPVPYTQNSRETHAVSCINPVELLYPITHTSRHTARIVDDANCQGINTAHS